MDDHSFALRRGPRGAAALDSSYLVLGLGPGQPIQRLIEPADFRLIFNGAGVGLKLPPALIISFPGENTGAPA